MGTYRPGDFLSGGAVEALPGGWGQAGGLKMGSSDPCSEAPGNILLMQIPGPSPDLSQDLWGRGLRRHSVNKQFQGSSLP